MDFFLMDSSNSNDKVHFPLNPEKVTMAIQSKMETHPTIELGDITFPRGNLPDKIQFEGKFLGEARKDMPFVKDWRRPMDIVGQMTDWKKNGTKLHFIVTETSINQDVYIDTFEPVWGGGYGDCEFTLQLTEARTIYIPIIGADGTVESAQSISRPAPAQPKTYMVKSGDNLWVIAKTQMGSGSRWPDIYADPTNRSTIGPNPDNIQVGMVLNIPA